MHSHAAGRATASLPLAACHWARCPLCWGQTGQPPRPTDSVSPCACSEPYYARQGVCVAAYGADEFPAFFARASGCAAPARVDTPAQAAALVRAALALRPGAAPAGGCGVVIGAPRLPASRGASHRTWRLTLAGTRASAQDSAGGSAELSNQGSH
jgi:hypothetical protein